MDASTPRIVILGGGPAGVGAAYRLARRGGVQVTLVEQLDRVGGAAGSFVIEGVPVDFGSHRLHPGAPPDILGDIRDLLGDDLLERKRHGRIWLRGRALHFPLRPLDLLIRLPPAFSAGVALDTVSGLLHGMAARETRGEPSFASELAAGLGATICRDFYFPYAQKIWGIPPSDLAASLARQRVSANSPIRMLRKLADAVPFIGSGHDQRFLYPRQGYGQISQAYAAAATRAGATIRLGASVEEIFVVPDEPARVVIRSGDQRETIETDAVWSTVPLTVLARALRPEVPDPVQRSFDSLQFRGILLVYLVLDATRYGEYDAYYFPELTTPVARCSEPKNYHGTGPSDTTVLCAEVPCDPSGALWNAPDEELGEIVAQAFVQSGLPRPGPVRHTITRRLPHAYPVYRRGYERELATVMAWLDTIPRLLTFGRQGLFVHDNADHALSMAYAAVDCLDPDGAINLQRWRIKLKEFEQHIVAD